MKHLFRIALGGAKIRLLLAIAIVFLCACGEEHIETLTLGPYEVPCVGAFEQDCYLEYNADSGRWEFFYDGISGFDFEPGYFYTLEVRLEDVGTEYQDAGRYDYHLVRTIDKKKAPDDFDHKKGDKPE